MPGVNLIDDLRSDIAAGRVIVLAGAGLSKNVAGSAALDWRALLHTGVQHLASLNEDSGWCQWAEGSLKFQLLDPLLSVAEATERRLKERQEFSVWLRRQFETLSLTNPQPLQSLAAWQCRVMTTNYDTLLEQGLGRQGITWQDGGEVSRFSRGESNAVLHLHGCWNNQDSVVLGIRSYVAVATDQPTQSHLKANVLTKSLVLIGCSDDGLTDPNIGQFLQWLRTLEREMGVECRHYRLYCDKEPTPAQDGRVFPVRYGADFGELGAFLHSLIPAGQAEAAAAGESVSVGVRSPRAAWPESVLRYVDALAEKTARLNLLGFGKGLQIDLPIHRAWVPLRVLWTPAMGNQRPGRAVREQGERDLQGVNDVFRKEAGETYRGALLLGEPGAGKTTAARQLAWRLASAAVDPTTLGLPAGICPVFLRFRDLSQQSATGRGGLGQFLQQSLFRKNAPQQFQNPGQDLWDSPAVPILWILDGLDEVVDHGVRKQVAGWVSRTLADREKDRFLVTCRFAGFNRAGLELPEGFREFHVQPLSAADQQQFVTEWFGIVYERLAQPATTAQQKAQRLLSKLADSQYQTQKMRELTGNPMLLTVLCLVFHDNEDLPRQRGAVYERCVEVLLEHWRKSLYSSPTGARLQPLEPSAVREVLMQVAWWLHAEENRTAESQTVLAKQAEEVLQLMNPDYRQKLTAEQFLDRVVEETGILAGEQDGRLSFLHLTFQEFLVARSAVAGRKAQFLGQRVAASDWWLEATLLALQSDRDFCKEFFRSLLQQPRLEERPKVLTDCLTEAQFVESEPFVEVLRDADNRPERATLVLNSLQGRAAQLPALADAAEQLLKNGTAPLQQVAFDFLQRAGRKVAAIRGSGAEQSLFDDRIQTTFVRIPAGKFRMGRKRAGKNADDWQHPVQITRPFLLARTPVTNSQYELFLKAHPDLPKPSRWDDRRFNQPSQPVVGVSWHDAVQYCDWAGGRLPTEAEWEYACRAGSEANYCFGDDEAQLDQYVWYDKNSGGTTQAVGLKKPNEWGLYDVHGNVWEWCGDWYDKNWYQQSPERDPVGPPTGEGRVLRGGCWYISSDLCSAWYRLYFTPQVQNLGFGFRLARTLLPDG